jgi:hypothetical protein
MLALVCGSVPGTPGTIRGRVGSRAIACMSLPLRPRTGADGGVGQHGHRRWPLQATGSSADPVATNDNNSSNATGA